MSAASPAAPVLRFRSKRDSWISALLALVMLVCAVSLFAMLRVAREDPAYPIAAFSPLITFALVLWLLRTIAYEIAGDGLHARCGPLHFRVPFAEIEAVTPKRGLSLEMGWSLALSLDRLLVRRRCGLALAISPEPRELFLSELAARCPHLVREADRLVRRAGA